MVKIALVALLVVLSGCSSAVGSFQSHTVYSIAMEHLAWEPSYEPNPGSEMQTRVMQLEQFCQNNAIMLERTTLDGLWGRSSLQYRIIQIREGLSPNAEFEVLAHELGHFFQPPPMSPGAAEVFAEMVVVHLGQLWHYDYTNSAAAYLARHKEWLQVAHIYDKEIRYAAQVLAGQKKVPEFLKPQGEQ